VPKRSPESKATSEMDEADVPIDGGDFTRPEYRWNRIPSHKNEVLPMKMNTDL